MLRENIIPSRLQAYVGLLGMSEMVDNHRTWRLPRQASRR
jgi:hypothetical protein